MLILTSGSNFFLLIYGLVLIALSCIAKLHELTDEYY